MLFAQEFCERAILTFDETFRRLPGIETLPGH